MYGIDVGGGPLGLVFPVLASIILIAAWVILAGSRFIQGGVVERPERVPQLYGYTVCLIALIWGIASLVSIVENGIRLSAPEFSRSSEFGWEASVTSFESFRTSYDRVRLMSAGDPREAKLDSVPEAELRKRFEALRADRIRQGRFEAQRNLIVATLSLLIAAGVFLFHWRWLRRTTATTT